jgi:hypothetical protein
VFNSCCSPFRSCLRSRNRNRSLTIPRATSGWPHQLIDSICKGVTIILIERSAMNKLSMITSTRSRRESVMMSFLSERRRLMMQLMLWQEPLNTEVDVKLLMLLPMLTWSESGLINRSWLNRLISSRQEETTKLQHSLRRLTI